MLPKTSAYVKSYDGQTKWMYILIKEDNLLEKCNAIWNKVSADIKKEFDRKHVYKKNILKIKIRSFGDEATSFFNKEIRKVNSNHTCLAVISLDSALKKNENYHLQLFSKVCKHIEKKVIRHNIDDLESSSDDFGEE